MPFAVVLLAPNRQRTPHVFECSEPGCVEALVAQPAVEARKVSTWTFCSGATRLDVHQTDLPVLGPADHASRSELRPVVQAHVFVPASWPLRRKRFVLACVQSAFDVEDV